LSTARNVSNAGGYLRTSVVNGCRDLHRHGAVVARNPLPRPDDVVDHHDELFDALAKLPWRQHAALVLRFHVDLAEHDIAETLGCRPSTVRSLTRRGLATLRKALES
jgi:RNA polymerase sigma factor (sigma-70 family)